MVPITDCMKDAKCVWIEEVERTFELIKVRFRMASILVLSYFHQAFELHVDALKVGIGVVLSQNSRLIAYFSEKLSRSKLWYNTYDVGFYTIVKAIKHW